VLLDNIKIVRNTGRRKPGDTNTRPKPDLVGLRDRALIGVMVFTFARINAVPEMKVRDYFVQGRRGWVRLDEKGGKQHELPCHHSLEKYLDEYLPAAGIADDLDGPLFRTTGRKTGKQQPMCQQDAYRMIQRRARAAGIKTRIGNHTFRATGITTYLKKRQARTRRDHGEPFITTDDETLRIGGRRRLRSTRSSGLRFKS
jgi:site-specific recombinase XerD